MLFDDQTVYICSGLEHLARYYFTLKSLNIYTVLIMKYLDIDSDLSSGLFPPHIFPFVYA